MLKNRNNTQIQEQQIVNKKEQSYFESDFQKFLRENGMYEEISNNEDNTQPLKKIEGVKFEIVDNNGRKGVEDWLIYFYV